MKANVVYHAGYVKIDYQHEGGRTRKSTGVAIPDKSYLKANRELKSTVVDYQEKQKIINSFYAKAQKIIEDFQSENHAFPTGEQFKRAWDEHEKEIKTSKYLLDYYNLFYSQKEKEFQRKGFNTDSIKDYRNIRYYLEDFITSSGKPIYLDEISRDWMNGFVLFLENPREDYNTNRNKGGKYWTRGGLAPITIKRRVGLFIGFLKWLADEKLFEYPKGLTNYYRSIKDSDAVKSAITREEANKLYDYDFENKKENFIKDVFIFSCFTGIRWEDICQLQWKNLVDVADIGKCIVKVANKTQNEFSVPANEVVLEIINRYDCNFKRYKNSDFNKCLKKMLARTGLFNEETRFEFNGRFLKRWECISIHRGRDSFCTMMLSLGVPVNEVMRCTGHKSIVSLNRYIDLNAKRVESSTAKLVMK